MAKLDINVVVMLLMIENAQLVEVNGSEVRDRSLNEVIPMLQGSDEVIRLRLARLMSIPERDFNATMSRSSRYAQSGASGCEKGLIKCFLRVPQAVRVYCSCHAAQASEGNFLKTFYKIFGTDCMPLIPILLHFPKTACKCNCQHTIPYDP